MSDGMSEAGPITILMMGDPVAWARAQGGRTKHLFTPTKQRNNAATWKMLASEKMIGRLPFDRPVVVDLLVEVAIPSSWSAKKQQAAIRDEIRPGKKPDLDNVCKQIGDSFNGVVWRDDALVVEYTTLRKVYSLQPKTVVTVRAFEPGVSRAVGPLFAAA